MRFLNIETGARYPTTPEEMAPLQAYFAQQCDVYFNQALERSQLPENNIHRRHLPSKTIPAKTPYGLAEYWPPRDVLDAPIDTSRLNFKRFNYGGFPAYLLLTYIPDYGDSSPETYEPPENWARQRKKALEVNDAFMVNRGESRRLDYQKYIRRTVRFARSTDYLYAAGITLRVQRATKDLGSYMKILAPSLPSEARKVLSEQGPQAVILHRASEMLTAAAFMAGADPSEPARHTLVYTPEI